MRAKLKGFASWRALGLGAVLAALGFTYVAGNAGVTQRQVILPIPSTPGVGSVGSQNGRLNFNNVIVLDEASENGDDYDLGELVLTEEFEKVLTAGGGLKPYTFSGGPAFAPGSASGALLDRSGVLRGTVVSQVDVLPFPPDPNLPGITGILAFTGTVADVTGVAPITGDFFIYTSTPGARGFRLANPINLDLLTSMRRLDPTGVNPDVLHLISSGEVGLSYAEKLETINEVVTISGDPNLDAPFADPLRDRPIDGQVTFLPDNGNHPFTTKLVTDDPVLRIYDAPDGAEIAAFDTLEEAGLSMSYDGWIHGVPLFSGWYVIDTLVFDGKVLSGGANKYRNDSPLNPDPTDRVVRVGFSVAANNRNGLPTESASLGQTATDLVIQRLQVRTSNGAFPGKDSLTFQGRFNQNGQFELALRNQQNLHIRFGSFHWTFPIELNGNSAKTVYVSDGLNQGTTIAVEINTKVGSIRGSISKTTLNFQDGALTVNPDNRKRIPFGVGVGNLWQAGECLEMQIRAVGLNTLLQYKYGNPGLAAGVPIPFNRTLGGVFLPLTVGGQPGKDVSFAPGHKWKVSFLMSPRVLIDDPAALLVPDGVLLPDSTNITTATNTPGLNAVQSVAVRIGTWQSTWGTGNPLFETMICKPAGPSILPTLRCTDRFLRAGVQSFSLSDKNYSGSVSTYPVAGPDGSPKSGIPLATSGGADVAFPFSVIINRPTAAGDVPVTSGFDAFGEEGAVLRPNNTSYQNTP
ncbi:MAG: hypothetical protein AMXMBFR7_31590 [Planctomycetota bacterium]